MSLLLLLLLLLKNKCQLCRSNSNNGDLFELPVCKSSDSLRLGSTVLSRQNQFTQQQWKSNPKIVTSQKEEVTIETHSGRERRRRRRSRRSLCPYTTKQEQNKSLSKRF